MKILETFVEVLGWLRIVASPLLISGVIAAVVYVNHPEATGKLQAIAIVAIGLITGVAAATYIWKKYGTMWFMSRVNASPELGLDKDSTSQRSRGTCIAPPCSALPSS